MENFRVELDLIPWLILCIGIWIIISFTILRKENRKTKLIMLAGYIIGNLITKFIL